MVVIGWDIGGAHLKAARIETGRVTDAKMLACPLWQGLDHLHAAFAGARQELGDAPLHAVTMTGELSDIFASREQGVAELCALIAKTLPSEIRVYGGREGWLSLQAAPARAAAVASANWHASAALLARSRSNTLFADMGSTTTDLVPVAAGGISARGHTDAERLAAGELVYTGATRTSLMAVAARVPFRGTWTPVMNEYFASTADVHRILGELPAGADLHATPDGREKTFAASYARLARMVGADVDEADEAEWKALARFFAEAQLRTIHNAALQVLSAAQIPPDAPVVVAGIGRFVLEKLAARLDRPVEGWEAIVPANAGMAGAISDCAPAVAVGLLLAAAQGSPP
jgi:probable H4MPT-linked C1 transfer pathway protein